MPRLGLSRAWRGAAVCALIAFAVMVVALANADSRPRIVALPRLTPTTRVARLHGRETLLIVDLEVARVAAGVKVRISCKGCRRLPGPTESRRSGSTRSLRGVNWLLASGRAIRISTTRRGALGRVLVLVAGPGRLQLVVGTAACLSFAGRPAHCPAGVRNPRPGTPAADVTPQGQPTATPTITLRATFDNGTAAPLSPQCAPTTPSTDQRYRGTYAVESSIVGKGTGALQITLPQDPDPRSYPLEVCDLTTPLRPIALGTDSYIGLMVYVPVGWTIPPGEGVNIYELHFQDIYGAPITLNLRPDHVTIQLETGACHNHATARPECANRSNADLPTSGQTMAGHYAIPPGALIQGAWNEVVLHVRWSRSRSGQIQSYYRVKGGRAWVRSSNIRRIPTVQWDITRGCCNPSYVDELEAYTFAFETPLSVWFDNIVDATSLRAVEATMPR